MGRPSQTPAAVVRAPGRGAARDLAGREPGTVPREKSVRQRQCKAGAQALALYEEKADALLEAYLTGTPEAMERHYRHTWHRRAWRAMRTYVLLDLGKRPEHPDDDVEITLDDARHLVALEHGFPGWSDLAAFTSTLRASRRAIARPMRLVVHRGAHDWEPFAGSREWDEVLDLLAANPGAGLSAEGQMTDTLLAESPGPFRERNLFVSANALSRA